MATEIDALQLNITAETGRATRSINNLSTSLHKLGQKLGVFYRMSDITSNINNFGASITNLNNSVQAVDTKQIKDVASSTNSLYNALNKLSNFKGIPANIGSNGQLSSLASSFQQLQGLGQGLPDFSGIKSLADSMNKLSGVNATGASTALKGIADGLRSLQGISIPNIGDTTALAENLRMLGSKTIRGAGEALPKIVSSLSQFNTISIPQDKIAGLTELAKSLAIFGRQTSKDAVDIMPKFATAFRQLMEQLSRAPQISRNVIDLSNALGNFLANVRNVSGSTRQASSGMRLFSNSVSSSRKKLIDFGRIIGKFYAKWFLLLRAFHRIKQAIGVASDLKEVQNVVDTTFGQMTNKVEEFASSAVENFGMSELSAKKFASRFQAMGVAMGISSKEIDKAQQSLNKINPTLSSRGYSDTADSIADLSINITKLAADMASFYNVEQEDVAKDLEAIYTGMTRPLRQYGLDLSIATLQEWAMKNGLDSNIKSMTQAEKTLLRYQYVLANTSAAQGDFAKTSLTWANQIRMLGQNFQRLGAVIGGGLIAWLRPAVVAINNAMDGIIAAVQRVVNALGKIFGWEMIVDTTGKSLIEDTEEVADAWDDATGAAKKYAKQLLGIDELNNLTTNDKGSGSGDDGGYGGMSGSNIIKPGGIEFKKFESDIDNLYDLGKKLSEAFANLLPDDWTEIYKKAANFGTGLADFLNGLIQPDTFFKVGKTIAGALMTAITSLASFSDRADWEQYGEALGEGINGFFEEFDGAKFALGLNKFASGVLKAIRKALKTVDWGKVWEDIVGFIKNLSPDTIKLVLGTVLIKKVTKWLFGGAALNALKTALGTAIANKLKGGITLSSLSLSIPKINIGLKPGTASGDVLWDWVYTNILTPFHEMLPSGLQSFIENTFAGGLGGGFIGSIVPGIGTVAGAIVGALIGAFTSEPVEPLREAIWNLISSAFRLEKEPLETWEGALYWFGKIKEDFEEQDWLGIGEDILMGIMGAILSPIEFIAAPFKNLFEWIWNGIRDIFGIHSPSEEMKPIGEDIVLGILDGFGLVDFMKKVTDWWDENVAPWFTFDRWSKLGQGIYDGLTTKWNEFTSYFKLDDIWSFITNTFSLDTWTGYGKDILDGLSTKWNEFTSLFELDDIWSFIQEKFSLDSWTFSSISEGLSGSFNAAWDAVKQGWNSFADWLENHMTIKFDNTPIGQGLSKMFGGATEAHLIKLPRFEYGGYPTQGSLFVAGETYGQSEWVGNINGRTGVVSGYEITDISRTIRDTSEAEMSLMRSQNEILMGILQKEFGISKDAIGEAARSYGREYYNRTGNQAFSY